MSKSSIEIDKGLNDFLKNPQKSIDKNLKGTKTKIECPNCKKQITVTINKKTKCPRCKNSIDFTF